MRSRMRPILGVLASLSLAAGAYVLFVPMSTGYTYVTPPVSPANASCVSAYQQWRHPDLSSSRGDLAANDAANEEMSKSNRISAGLACISVVQTSQEWVFFLVFVGLALGVTWLIWGQRLRGATRPAANSARST